MPVRHLKLVVPDEPPYDKQETWYQSFVGNKLLPLVEQGLFRRFMFTRYGGVGHGKFVLFRYEPHDLTATSVAVALVESAYSASPPEHTEYDVAGDIGRGERSRFLGPNSRHQDPARRGEVAFDFLHASARLFLDCLTGPDANGYWQLESDPKSGFTSIETTLEQFHHLFCNLSAVPTYVVLAVHPEVSGPVPLSFFHFCGLQNQDPRWQQSVIQKTNF